MEVFYKYNVKYTLKFKSYKNNEIYESRFQFLYLSIIFGKYIFLAICRIMLMLCVSKYIGVLSMMSYYLKIIILNGEYNKYNIIYYYCIIIIISMVFCTQHNWNCKKEEEENSRAF